jgi:hypothetical protein
MNCYNCGVEITEQHRSEEHVINNSLGGHLTSFDLLCDPCNNEFGHTLDAAIDGQIGMFTDLLGIKKHRENKDKRVRIEMVSQAGERKVVGKKLAPLHELSLDTGRKRVILFEEEAAYEKLKARKKEELGKKFKVEDREYIRQPDKTKYHVRNSISDEQGNIAFGGYEYLQGIARICLNFYLSRGHSIQYAGAVLDFVKGNKKFNDLVYYYFPVQYQIHDLGRDEVSHVLHIHGDSRSRMLYGYAELFNFQNVLVIFDRDYRGPDIDESYSYDLINGVEMDKKVALRLFRHHVEIMHLIERDADPEHLARYNRFLQIVEKRQLS